MRKNKKESLKDKSIFFSDRIEEKDNLLQAIEKNLEYRLAKNVLNTKKHDVFLAVAMTLRDRLVSDRLRTKQKQYEENRRTMSYLSMEFLMGRLVSSTLINLGLYDECRDACKTLGFELNDVLEEEIDMGLGNGGLGRLAACFLDSLASLELPSIGYGLFYRYGIFEQTIVHNKQYESPDNWLKLGTPWDVLRSDRTYSVYFGGEVQMRRDDSGKEIFELNRPDEVLAVAHDIHIPGYKNNYVNDLRLWKARSQSAFDFHKFNKGDYISSVEGKNEAENITKALYPNDNTVAGKELRLKQQYFFVSASIQDILRKHRSRGNSIRNFSEKNILQLNDTHPAVAIAEMMHILLDKEQLDWDSAWDITQNCFAYTNHTVLTEALEKWSVELFKSLLPRHLQIIYEINCRFLNHARAYFRNDQEKIRNMSLIEEGDKQKIRMAHLAIVGSKSVNGVAGLHTEIIKKRLFKDFYELYPEKFSNKTNGVTHRRWLISSNTELADLICEANGDAWVHDFDRIADLEKHSEDPAFMEKWDKVKEAKKHELIKIVREKNGITLNPDSIFDVQIKRIHEYKRQLLALFHVITLYNRIKDNPSDDYVPRTVIFGGKAAPGYDRAKEIIHLINEVAAIVNTDRQIGERLKVVFIENYSVSLAEKIIPAANLSEQISTAGYEASGTGNMKFMMNGALTIGTEDGANIEIADEVGRENMFMFGLDADGISTLRKSGYFPNDYINGDRDLSRIFDMIENNFFSPIEFGVFNDMCHNLRTVDFYCLMADYRSYIDAQKKVEEEFADRKLWTKKSIINTARSGRFSSDRTISDYNRDIWHLDKG